MGSGMTPFIALSFILVALVTPATAEDTTVDLELVLAVDVSFSMDPRAQLVQRTGYVDAFQNPLVIDAILGWTIMRGWP